MSPQAAQAAHETMMREHIAPALHERGFTGQSAFRRQLPTGWHLLSFQGSMNSSGSVLLGVDVGAITEKAWAEKRAHSAEFTPAVKIPELPTATWVDSERLGILRMGLDNWYEYSPNSDMVALCARIMKDVDKYALPFMAKRVPVPKA